MWNANCSTRGRKDPQVIQTRSLNHEDAAMGSRSRVPVGEFARLANVQYTFYASGVTESYAQEGTAVFSFSNDGSSLSITLTDTVDPTTAVLSSITGLQVRALGRADQHVAHIGQRRASRRLHELVESVSARRRVAAVRVGNGGDGQRRLARRRLRRQFVLVPAVRNRQCELCPAATVSVTRRAIRCSSAL